MSVNVLQSQPRSEVSIQNVGVKKCLCSADLPASFSDYIFPSFDGQDYSAAIELLPSPLSPKPILNVIELKDAYLFIGPGVDGVVATADGDIIRETARFAFTFETPSALEMEESAEYVDSEWLSIVDCVWHNHYHLLALAIPRLLIANEQCENIQIVIPDRGSDISAQSRMLDHIVDLAKLSNKIVKLPNRIYKVRSLRLIWTNYRQPPFIHLLPFVFSYLDRFASSIIDTTGVITSQRIFIVRSTNKRMDDPSLVSRVDYCLERYGFTKVQLEKQSLEQQILLFRNATHVVGAHGAGLTNLIFGQNGLRVLEFNSDVDGKGFTRPWFLLIAAGKNIRYQFVDINDRNFQIGQIDEAFRRLMSPDSRSGSRWQQFVNSFLKRFRNK